LIPALLFAASAWAGPVMDEAAARRAYEEVRVVRSAPTSEAFAHLYRDVFPDLDPVYYAMAMPFGVSAGESETADQILARTKNWFYLHAVARKECFDLLSSRPKELAGLVSEDYRSGERAKLERALYATGRFKLSGSFDDAVQVFRRSQELREKAAYALRDVDDPKAVPVLLEAKGGIVSYFELLRSLSRDRLPAPELARLLRAKDPGVRWRATYALAESRDPSLLPEALRLSKDADPAVREQASNMLALFKDAESKKAQAALLELLKDPEPRVRFQAATELARRGDKAAGKTLVGLLREGKMKDYESSIVEGLNTLAGTYFGYDKSKRPNEPPNPAALDRFDAWLDGR
jgi:hypothetical protein